MPIWETVLATERAIVELETGAGGPGRSRTCTAFAAVLQTTARRLYSKPALADRKHNGLKTVCSRPQDRHQ